MAETDAKLKRYRTEISKLQITCADLEKLTDDPGRAADLTNAVKKKIGLLEKRIAKRQKFLSKKKS